MVWRVPQRITLPPEVSTRKEAAIYKSSPSQEAVHQPTLLLSAVCRGQKLGWLGVLSHGWRPCSSPLPAASSAFPYRLAKTFDLELFLNLADDSADLRMATA